MDAQHGHNDSNIIVGTFTATGSEETQRKMTREQKDEVEMLIKSEQIHMNSGNLYENRRVPSDSLIQDIVSQKSTHRNVQVASKVSNSSILKRRSRSRREASNESRASLSRAS